MYNGVFRGRMDVVCAVVCAVTV